jgi:hypothetical protein
MKFPWNRRADRAHTDRVAAENRLKKVRGDWPKVHAEVADIRQQREINGWTATITTLFAGRQPGGST